MRALFDDGEDPILVFQEGDISKFVDFNRAACEFFGYGPAYFRELVRNDGSVISADVRGKRLPDESTLITLRDVTEQQQIEERLR